MPSSGTEDVITTTLCGSSSADMSTLVRMVRTASENADCESLKKASSEMNPFFLVAPPMPLMNCSTPNAGTPRRCSTPVVELSVLFSRSSSSASIAANTSATAAEMPTICSLFGA